MSTGIDFDAVMERMDAEHDAMDAPFTMLFAVCDIAGMSMDDIDEILRAIDIIAKHTGLRKTYIAAIIRSYCMMQSKKISMDVYRSN